jgi:hypothetical protein
MRIHPMLPPPVFSGNLGIRRDVIHLQVIPRIRKVTREENLTTMNQYVLFFGHEEYFPDKVYPNTAGARKMAARVYWRLTGEKPPADAGKEKGKPAGN